MGGGLPPQAAVVRFNALKVPGLGTASGGAEIARTCGVAPLAVYWHFPSEADLRSAMLDTGYASLVEAVESALDTPAVVGMARGRLPSAPQNGVGALVSSGAKAVDTDSRTAP